MLFRNFTRFGILPMVLDSAHSDTPPAMRSLACLKSPLSIPNAACLEAPFLTQSSAHSSVFLLAVNSASLRLSLVLHCFAKLDMISLASGLLHADFVLATSDYSQSSSSLTSRNTTQLGTTAMVPSHLHLRASPSLHNCVQCDALLTMLDSSHPDSPTSLHSFAQAESCVLILDSVFLGLAALVRAPA